MSSSNIIYSAVVLDEKSRERLIARFQSLIPEGWTIIAHHMTIVPGKGLPDYLKLDEGKQMELSVIALGLSDMAMAVEVGGYYTKKDIPHITIAVNPEGGKPEMSNDITTWHNLSKSLTLTGIVSQITQ